jgi:hypothetical protein
MLLNTIDRTNCERKEYLSLSKLEMTNNLKQNKLYGNR